MKKKLGIVGPGRVGLTVAYLLRQKGYPIVAVAGRSAASPSTTRAAGVLGCDIKTPEEVATEAEVLFLTTPDGTIREVCEQLARARAFRPGQIVGHMSGAFSSCVLEAARPAGAHLMSLHPLQSFARFDPEVTLRGTYFSAEGDPPALAIAREIVSDLEGIFVQIDAESKALYHAGACVASNYFASLMDVAVRLFTATGIPEKDALHALMPLVEGTVANLKRVGLPAALTGPISRGDSVTIHRHLQEMARLEPEIHALYRLLGRYTTRLARAKGAADAEKIDQVLRVLEEGRPNGQEGHHPYPAREEGAAREDIYAHSL